jgi:hypothetical protein
MKQVAGFAGEEGMEGAGVFRVDVTVCPHRGGTMKIIAVLTHPHAFRTYIEGVGLTSRPPPVAPARPRPQTSFDFHYLRAPGAVKTSPAKGRGIRLSSRD